MKLYLSKLLIFLLLSSFFFPTLASGITIENPLKYETFDQIIKALINFVFTIALAAAPLMIIIAGFLFVTAAGNPDKVSQAKRIIWYTVIGLVIVFLANTLVDIIQKIVGG